MNGLDLFSGIGGVSIALEPWVQTIAYCEREQYAQGVLLSRMESGELDIAPIWDDVTTLRGEMLDVPIDIITAGFPCQDLSIGGLGKGLAGERSGLFFEVARLAEELRPSFLFLENVPAIRTRGAETVCKTLASLGYDMRWTTVTASSVGAKHRRERWFLLAHTNQPRSQGRIPVRADAVRETSERNLGSDGSSLSPRRTSESRPYCHKDFWAVEPSVGRVVDGLPRRVDRIKCLGNSVVPLQVREAFEKLLNMKGK
jgi:DNA (cytosine-5)-methyltransferase 1